MSEITLRKIALTPLLCLAFAAACGGGGPGEVECEREGITLEDGIFVRDVECGEGAQAERGMTATVAYSGRVGEEAGRGELFDRSGPEGLTFRLGAGQVVAGWDEGLVGMRVGGTRALVVPPDLAYGDAGLPPDVPPDATVTFEVELLELSDNRDE
jgi:FKBP-type peptidyl-prolyl cis-trans isomerase FkpA